jgi:hypothetical protein
MDVEEELLARKEHGDAVQPSERPFCEAPQDVDRRFRG